MVFKPVECRFGTPTATVHKGSAYIYLNKSACLRWKVRDYTHAQIVKCDTSGRFGLALTNEPGNAYAIHMYGKGGVYISCQTIIKGKLAPGTYRLHWDEGVIVIESAFVRPYYTHCGHCAFDVTKCVSPSIAACGGHPSGCSRGQRIEGINQANVEAIKKMLESSMDDIPPSD